jgi:hypothetical protein
MALPPRGERLPSEMNEGTDYGYKGHKGPTYGLRALGLLGPSPSAQFYSILTGLENAGSNWSSEPVRWIILPFCDELDDWNAFWEVKSHPPCQKFVDVRVMFWVHFRGYKSCPMNRIPRQMNSSQAQISASFNGDLSSTPRSYV